MAPEQWTDAGAADARTDIYALGVLVLRGADRPAARSTARPAIELARAHARAAGAAARRRLPAGARRGARAARSPSSRPTATPPRSSSPPRFRAAAAIGDASRSRCRGCDDDAARRAAWPRAPQPLAEAVAALDAARNAHQARDAVLAAGRASRSRAGRGRSRWPAHAHVGPEPRGDRRGARRARCAGCARGALDDAELARARARAGARRSPACATPTRSPSWSRSCRPASARARRAARRCAPAGDAGRRQRRAGARAARARRCRSRARLLDALRFLAELPPGACAAATAAPSVWMGVAPRGAPRRPAAPPRLPPGPAGRCSTPTGRRCVSLWPLVQVARADARRAPTRCSCSTARAAAAPAWSRCPTPSSATTTRCGRRSAGMLRRSAPPTARRRRARRCPYRGLAAFTARRRRALLRPRARDRGVPQPAARAAAARGGRPVGRRQELVRPGRRPARRCPPAGARSSLRPGPAPLASLAARLAAPASSRATLRGDRRRARPIARRALRARAARHRCVLVVDQLEELFTLCDDAGRARALRRGAGRAPPRSADDPVRVVLTLRDDFLVRAEALPAAARPARPRRSQLLTTPGARRPPPHPRRAGAPRRLRVRRSRRCPTEMVDAVAEPPGALRAALVHRQQAVGAARPPLPPARPHAPTTSLGGVGGALGPARRGDPRRDARRASSALVREVLPPPGHRRGHPRGADAARELDQLLGGGAARRRGASRS